MKNAFSEFLRARRLELGRTQQQVADACGVTATAITWFEKGRRRPRLDLVPVLADVLEVDRQLLCRLALETRAGKFFLALGEEHVETAPGLQPLRAREALKPPEPSLGPSSEAAKEPELFGSTSRPSPASEPATENSLGGER
jgi:transcriptional regulator with XRE-family HTH domain